MEMRKFIQVWKYEIPSFFSLDIWQYWIGEFIGPGGKNIKGLSEKYECEISIDDDGSCTILSSDQDSIDNVIAHIGKMT